MDPSVAIQFIVLIVLLLLSAFFSSAETSLVTVNQIRMRSLADEGNKKAARVLKITSNSSKMLSAILIGNNPCNNHYLTVVGQQIRKSYYRYSYLIGIDFW